MSEPIVSIARIEQQALKAAETYDDVNDACPYPFGTEAGRLFKATFNEAVLQQKMAIALAAGGQAAMKGVAV